MSDKFFYHTAESGGYQNPWITCIANTLNTPNSFPSFPPLTRNMRTPYYKLVSTPNPCICFTSSFLHNWTVLPWISTTSLIGPSRRLQIVPQHSWKYTSNSTWRTRDPRYQMSQGRILSGLNPICLHPYSKLASTSLAKTRHPER